jgi:hypothetical protein
VSRETQYPGLLSDDQLRALAACQKGVLKVAELALRINTMNADHKLGLPSLQVPSTGAVYHAIEGKVFYHELDESRLRRHLGAAMKQEAVTA